MGQSLVDDVRIETFDVTAPGITEFAGSAGGVRVQLQDAPTSALNLESLIGTFNGAPVNLVSNKTDGVTRSFTRLRLHGGWKFEPIHVGVQPRTTSEMTTTCFRSWYRLM